jgi:hypothetical protein
MAWAKDSRFCKKNANQIHIAMVKSGVVDRSGASRPRHEAWMVSLMTGNMREKYVSPIEHLEHKSADG